MDNMTNSDAVRNVALDKISLAALRQADSIAFHHRDGKSHITAGKKRVPDARNPFAQGEVLIDIACDASFGLTIGDSSPDSLAREFQCFECILYAQHDPMWQTITHILKPGDVLRLWWRPDAQTTTAHKEHGLHGDSLYLVVDRDEKRMTFLVESNVRHDNTARMIRQTAYTIA